MEVSQDVKEKEQEDILFSCGRRIVKHCSSGTQPDTLTHGQVVAWSQIKQSMNEMPRFLKEGLPAAVLAKACKEIAISVKARLLLAAFHSRPSSQF